MAISTGEIELHTAALKLEQFGRDNPKTLAWLLTNFAAIVAALGSGSEAVDTTALEASILALQTQLAAMQTQIDGLDAGSETPPFDPSALVAAIADLQGQIDAIVIPPPTPPFTMPPGGTNGQILTHGTGGDGDYFWRRAFQGYAPAQTGDVIVVNEGTDEEAELPEFLLDPDGRVMLVLA